MSFNNNLNYAFTVAFECNSGTGKPTLNIILVKLNSNFHMQFHHADTLPLYQRTWQVRNRDPNCYEKYLEGAFHSQVKS